MFETLTLDQLRLFLCVAEEGSFSAAGRKLDRVQSAVSQGIANLEDALGVTLFDRSKRRPELTASGKALLLDAQQVFAQVSLLRTRAASIRQGVEAEVSVVVDAIVPGPLLVRMCTGFQEQFPTVSLRLQTEVVSGVSELVRDGVCHLGLAGTMGAGRGLTSRFLTNVAMVPVAHCDHPLAQIEGAIPTSAVRDQVQIVISQRGISSGVDHGVLSDRSWRVADAATKLTLLREGLGWGNLPCELVQDDLRSGRLTQLHLQEWGVKPLRVALCSIVRTDTPPGPAGQWLLKHLHDIADMPGATSEC